MVARFEELARGEHRVVERSEGGFDDELQGTVDVLRSQVAEEIKRFPRDLYPARGAVLLLVSQGLDELGELAGRLQAQPRADAV